MKKVFVSILFILSVLVSKEAIAGTNDADEIIIDPTSVKDQGENVKKSSANTYNFTLFNFFGTSSTSKADSSTTTVTESKELDGELIPKIAL